MDHSDDNEPGDSQESEEREVYVFVAGGEACERCQALAGSQWREPPDPPHAHCACDVDVRVVGRREQRECGDNTWTLEPLQDGTVHYGPAGSDTFEWGFLVTIDCWDGLVHEFEIWVDMGADSDYAPGLDGFADMEAFAWNEVYDEAEEIAAQVCRPCPDLIVS
jgi:hypothetical protein